MANVASLVNYTFYKTAGDVRIIARGQESGNGYSFIPMQTTITVSGVKKTTNDVSYPFDRPGQPFTQEEMVDWATANGYDLDRGETAANQNIQEDVYTS